MSRQIPSDDRHHGYETFSLEFETPDAKTYPQYMRVSKQYLEMMKETMERVVNEKYPFKLLNLFPGLKK